MSASHILLYGAYDQLSNDWHFGSYYGFADSYASIMRARLAAWQLAISCGVTAIAVVENSVNGYSAIICEPSGTFIYQYGDEKTRHERY